MKDMLKLILLVFAVLSSNAHAFTKELMVIYFIPFEVQTYIPITKNTIISSAWEKFEISDKTTSNRFIRLFVRHNNNKIEFDEKNVRILVVHKKDYYFVDMNGVAVKNDMLFRIDKIKFLQLRDSVPSTGRHAIKNK
jgi:hypothetical protein